MLGGRGSGGPVLGGSGHGGLALGGGVDVAGPWGGRTPGQGAELRGPPLGHPLAGVGAPPPGSVTPGGQDCVGEGLCPCPHLAHFRSHASLKESEIYYLG